jgi:mono/diheme cytochrome c family protein
MKNCYFSGSIFMASYLILLVILLIGCDRNRNNTGWDYFPDMFYSIAYETYSENPNFKDGLTMRVPVPGTVARDVTPFNYTIDQESRTLAGLELTNPVLPAVEAIERGRNIYTIFCAGCHGMTGEGDGSLFTEGLYPMKPRLLTGKSADQLKDGEIFHTITLGFGSMGAHGSQMRTGDIWQVVLYIRKLQDEARKNQAKADIITGK